MRQPIKFTLFDSVVTFFYLHFIIQAFSLNSLNNLNYKILPSHRGYTNFYVPSVATLGPRDALRLITTYLQLTTFRFAPQSAHSRAVRTLCSTLSRDSLRHNLMAASPQLLYSTRSCLVQPSLHHFIFSYIHFINHTNGYRYQPTWLSSHTPWHFRSAVS